MVLFGVVKHDCVDLALELLILNISKNSNKNIHI
jgi:hypothetical protein